MIKGKLDFFIIDDSDVNNYYTEDLLGEFDFTHAVTTYTRAKDGLAELLRRIDVQEDLPNVLLLDIRMPEMDGFEFIEELEEQLDERTIETKIFILTSSKHRRDVEAFEKQSLACEFLNKPLEKAEFLLMLEKYFSE